LAPARCGGGGSRQLCVDNAFLCCKVIACLECFQRLCSCPHQQATAKPVVCSFTKQPAVAAPAGGLSLWPTSPQADTGHHTHVPACCRRCLLRAPLLSVVWC
jgi:hypothetical protein